MWALMDCNNFYASCERLFRPDLVGRPLVVLSNNDGCIIARSLEAKALGIPMGEPEFRARPLLRRHGVAVFSSNYALYGDLSRRVMAVAETVTPDVEQYSIDEAFLRLDPVTALQADALGHALRERIRQWVGIEVSIGLAPTRTLAKVCNRLAKAGEGVFRYPEQAAERDALLERFPVAAVWGIGRRQADKLAARGVTTALGLRDMDDAWLRRHLTVTGWRTALELRGMCCVDELAAPPLRRTLISSRSFGHRVTERAHLAEALAAFTTNAAERLRREALRTAGLSVFVRAVSGDAPASGCLGTDKSVTVSLVEPTSDTSVLIRAAHQGLDAAFIPGQAYAKAGIMLYDLRPRYGEQGNLLELGQAPRRAASDRLMAALDAINARHGRHTLRYAAQGQKPDDDNNSNAGAPWHLRRRYCSPRVTTCWEELPAARC